MGQDHGSKKTQDTRVVRHLPPGCDLGQTDETKAYVRLT